MSFQNSIKYILLFYSLLFSFILFSHFLFFKSRDLKLRSQDQFRILPPKRDYLLHETLLTPKRIKNSRSDQPEFCSFSSPSCFNLGACDARAPHLLISIYPWPRTASSPPISPLFASILEIIANSKHFTSNVDQACLLISSSFDLLDRDPLSPSFIKTNSQFQLKNGGKNHLLFNLFSGR